jgi:hypothetical protein
MPQKTLLIGFDPIHFARILRVYREHHAANEDVSVLALDAELGWLLTDAGIPYHSGESLNSLSSAENAVEVQQWMQAFLESEFSKKFVYRGISLFEVFSYSIHSYLLQVTYYADLCSRIKSIDPLVSRWILCTSYDAEDDKGIVSRRDPSGAVLRAARLVAKIEGIHLELLKEETREFVLIGGRNKGKEVLRFFFALFITILNVGVSAFVPRKSLRILASDNWQNMAPMLEKLPEAEVFLLDRAQVVQANLRSILRHRVRFVHLKKGKTKGHSKIVKSLVSEWEESKSALPGLSFGKLSLSSLIEEGIDSVIQYGFARALNEIDAAYLGIEKYSPDVVHLRASVSVQIHFPVLALVARALGTPSLELQHGLEYLGPGSMSLRHTAQYIAVYGTLIQKELINSGYSEECLLVTGSPRFDDYVGKKSSAPGKDDGALTVSVLIPDVAAWSYDTYAVVAYLTAAANAVKQIPGARAILKLRPGPDREAFHLRAIKDAFVGISYRIAQYEKMQDVLLESDVLISCYSTTVLEAMIARLPVVIASLHSTEQLAVVGHFGLYEKASALKISTNPEDLTRDLKELLSPEGPRKSVIANAVTFLAAQYSFDGCSSERTASFVRSLVSRSNRKVSN